jgi:XisH protein
METLIEKYKNIGCYKREYDTNTRKSTKIKYTMPAKDRYHDTVKNALIKDGWTITHDPLRIRLARGKNLFVDLGAERLLAAERGTEKIAVEVKSFSTAGNDIMGNCP